MDLSDLFFQPRADAIAAQHISRLLGLAIEGIEVTQATQYYDSEKHLTDPADRGPDNGIKLVAGKPAWVRVYLWSALGASGVAGTLEVQRRTGGLLYQTVATLGPDASSVTSLPGLVAPGGYATTRGTLSRTMNFVISGEEMIGSLRLIARVSAGSWNAEQTLDVGVHLRQTLRLAGVMISYNGPASMAPNAPNVTLAAPTLADLQNMSGTALTLLPVESTAVFRSVTTTFVQTNHLQQTGFPATGCGVEWDALHGRVANARTADGNQPGWIYYGLLPAGTPMGPVVGCGGGGVAVGPINDPDTLAHEAAHACGLKHAPAGGAPNPDPSFPAYEPYDPPSTPRGSIGEYGLDVNNGNIASPAFFRDFMSYAGPEWISPYSYGLLLDNQTLNPATVGVDNWWWKDLVYEHWRKWPIPEPEPPVRLELPMFPPSTPQDVISLLVKIERGAVAEVMHVARTRAHTGLSGARETTLKAQLRGVEGQVAASAPLYRLQTSACGCGAPGEDRDTFIAQAFVPDAEAGTALEIVSDDEVVWRRAAPSEPPRAELAKPKVDRRGNVTLSWRSSGDVEEYWLRWSRDRESWQALATGLLARRARLEAGSVPSGEGWVQLVAHDGFFSSYSEPVRVKLPERGPSVSILHPVAGRSYSWGQAMRLWGSVTETPSESTEIVWLVDGDEVARGLDTFVSLEPGDRTVTLRVGRTEVSVTVSVVSPPPE